VSATAVGARTFAHRSRDIGGRLVKGFVEAPSETVAVARLHGMGLSPVSVQEKIAGTGLDREIEIPLLTKKVKIGDLAGASRQLATMTAAGLPLLRSITIVGEQTSNAKLAAVLQDVAREVETGSNLSDALAHHPLEIPPIMVSMLRAGETGGFLDTALNSVATTFEKEAKLKATIKSAMTYPIAVLAIALIAVIAMLIFIVPIFKNMFAQFGGQLPLPTEILVVLSDQMWWILPVLVVAFFAASMYYKARKDTEGFRRRVHPLLLRVPIFGPLMGKVAVARFARNLSNMTAAGVPLLRALAVVGQTSGNYVLERASDRVAESVRLGRSMAAPLADEKLFPPMVVQMIAVGEESGAIDDMLAKVADVFDDQVEATANALTSLIEPLLISVLGVVVGGMVVALYLPIFTIASVVH
jgi:type IV pilus assembly protein PilC